jgi:hypothetical protein
MGKKKAKGGIDPFILKSPLKVPAKSRKTPQVIKSKVTKNLSQKVINAKETVKKIIDRKPQKAIDKRKPVQLSPDL